MCTAGAHPHFLTRGRRTRLRERSSAGPCFCSMKQLCLTPLSLSLSLPPPSVMLLDTTESTSELGWTTYPDTGVSICRSFRGNRILLRTLATLAFILSVLRLLELKLLDKCICVTSTPSAPPTRLNGPVGVFNRKRGQEVQLCDTVLVLVVPGLAPSHRRSWIEGTGSG